jgi:serine/threonine protein kinase
MQRDSLAESTPGRTALLEDAVARFEADWRPDTPPALDRYLPAAGPLRQAVLLELVHIDLEFRLKAGLAAGAADYLERFPELGAEASAAVDLIVAEYRHRARQTPAPSPDEYLRRFPQYRDLLAARLRPGPAPEPDDGATTPYQVPVPPPTRRSATDGAALPATLRPLAETLRQLQALTPEQLDQLPALAPEAPDVPALLGELARRGWLTAYQAEHLRQGRAKQLLFGPYLLLEPLGKGGMGQVFKARHRVMKRVVALKIIRKGHLPHGQAVQRFQQEIEAAAKLVHPNIVIAHDAGRAGDYHFLVMEYVEGVGLDALLKQQGRLPVAQACDIIRQAALGLQHAHERGLVHRDIKPGNLIGANGVVKILDLGLARVRYDPADRGSKALTQMGAVMGTPDYIAPEQIIDCSRVDGRADIYSLGCTLFQLLTGQAPFAVGNLSQRLDQHLRTEPRPASELRPDLPAQLDAILRKMLAKQPDQRYASAAEVATALAPFCATEAASRGNLPEQSATLASAPPDETIMEVPPKAIPVLPVPPKAIPVLPEPLAPAATDSAPPGVAGPPPRRRKLWLPLGAAAGFLLLVPLLWFVLQGDVDPGPGPEPKAPPPGEFTNKIGMKLKRIPAGKFVMGAPKSELVFDKTNEFNTDLPQHEVTITYPFYMGIYEVTIGQFREFVKDTKHVIHNGASVGYPINGAFNPEVNWENPGWPERTEQHPVTCVSLADANAFCAWLSKKEKRRSIGCPRKRNGNMRAGPNPPPRTPSAMTPNSSMNTPGTKRTARGWPTPSAPRSQTCGAFLTCTATPGNGVPILRAAEVIQTSP